MKIAFLEPHLGIYGGIRRVLELSNRLVQRGHKVTIYHSDGAPCTWMECRADTRPASHIAHEQHDVLIYNDPTRHDLDLAQSADAKLVVFYCLELYQKELMLPGVNFRSLLKHDGSLVRTLTMKRALYGNDLLLVNASWMQTWLREYLRLDSILLLGGVNTEMFYPIDVAKDPNVIRITYSGDPRPRKGTRFIEAARTRVQRELPNAVFDTYFGEGIPQSAMAQMYSAADIFIDGQLSAGWNNPVAEAMACKVPVICTDIGGVQDFAFHEHTALLVPPRDNKAMAGAILRLALDPALRTRLSRQAYDHIRKFSWDDSAANLEHILDTCLRNQGEGKRTAKTSQALTRMPLNSIDIMLDLKYRLANVVNHLRRQAAARKEGAEPS